MPLDATIWVDADATPKVVREVLVRAARKRDVRVVFVANRHGERARGLNVRYVTVASGPDVADDHIAEEAASGDLVITNDIPLAARVIPKGCMVVRPHGAEITPDNVSETLAVRDLADSLREIGVMTGGPPPFGDKDRQRFANSLDRWITRQRVG